MLLLTQTQNTQDNLQLLLQKQEHESHALKLLGHAGTTVDTLVPYP